MARKIEVGAAAGAAILQARGIQPTLAIVHLGDHPDAASYRRAIDQSARRAGISLRTIAVSRGRGWARLASGDYPFERRSSGSRRNSAKPDLPFAFRQMIGNQLSADKDVEGLTALNLGRLALDEPAVVPCTPAAILALIEDRLPDVRGRRVVVVKEAPQLGDRSAQILIAREATVIVCGIATADLGAETRRAEIAVVAIGRPRALGPEHVGDGALVIDVGINEDPDGNGVCGDVDTMAVLAKVAGITPVPGGVGPVTTAMLMANTVLLARASWSGPSARTSVKMPKHFGRPISRGSLVRAGLVLGGSRLIGSSLRAEARAAPNPGYPPYNPALKEENANLSVWLLPELASHPAYRQAIALFHRQYPGVSVRVSPIAKNDILTKLKIAIAGDGAVPDSRVPPWLRAGSPGSGIRERRFVGGVGCGRDLPPFRPARCRVAT